MGSADNVLLTKLLATMAERRATDLHLVVGNYPFLRISGQLINLTDQAIVTPEYIESAVDFFGSGLIGDGLKDKTDSRFIYTAATKARFRIHLFKQKGNWSVSVKLLPSRIANLKELALPKIIQTIVTAQRGIVFVVGPFGSGRSTTLSAILQEINDTRSEHILLLEQPLEHLFVNNKSIIEQREVGKDVASFAEGLEVAKEEDVNIVALGQVPDAKSLELVLELAESGRLVIAALDYDSAATTLNGILSDFSEEKIIWAKEVLSGLLVAILAQRLVPALNNGVVLACEVLTNSQAFRVLIKENRLQQLENILQTSRAEGMQSLDQSLLQLVQEGKISQPEARKQALNPQNFQQALRNV
ncbi:MAG: ATPase, T2SS/T4P/T4SS family [Candidatus Komeilibacteria bacterium]|nr:ATPase, T2SS/T4P/T4SS family [Candidatus Komeilibacteria bacterium]